MAPAAGVDFTARHWLRSPLGGRPKTEHAGMVSMVRERGRRAVRDALICVSRPSLLLAAVGAMALAGCMPDGQTNLSAAQPRGATVAFESIDGPPQAQFNALVQKLNDEAQLRRLAVISRDNPSAYRVRGYLAAKIVKGQTTIAWVWDVFDGDEHRALRITGEEIAKGHPHDAWTVADDAMLRRIARTSMEQLAAFLTSPESRPGRRSPAPSRTFCSSAIPPPRLSRPAFIACRRPIRPRRRKRPADDSAVPLPRRRPTPPAAVMSSREGLILAAISQ